MRRARWASSWAASSSSAATTRRFSRAAAAGSAAASSSPGAAAPSSFSRAFVPPPTTRPFPTTCRRRCRVGPAPSFSLASSPPFRSTKTNDDGTVGRFRPSEPSSLWRGLRRTTATIVRRCGSNHRRWFVDVPSSSFSSAPSSSSDDDRDDDRGVRRIAFLTDVEGDARYFDRFVTNSKILGFRPVPSTSFVIGSVDDSVSSAELGALDFPYDREVYFLDDDDEGKEKKSPDVVVYGGDVWDKGGSDLYVIRQLLSLRFRYGPDRVVFLIGNRDANKMRILQEIGVLGLRPHGEEGSPLRLPRHDGVYWLRGTGRPGDPLLLDDDRENGRRSSSVPSDGAADRLKWMLSRTMGSPDAFEGRRRELLRERELRERRGREEEDEDGGGADAHSSVSSVSDEQVVESYRRSCHPSSGEMGKYLSVAKLVHKTGEAMFVHGALPVTDDVLDAWESRRRRRRKPAGAAGDAGSSSKSLWEGDNDYDLVMPWLPRRDDGKQKGRPQETKKKKKEAHTAVSDPDEWIEALNEFASEQIEAWKRSVSQMERTLATAMPASDCEEAEKMNPSRELQRTVRGKGVWSTRGGYDDRTSDGDDNSGGIDASYGKLMQYCMGWTPDKKKNPTVVYASWQSNGMPTRFYPRTRATPRVRAEEEEEAHRRPTFVDVVRDFFDAANVRLIVSGHQPHGDAPTPIRLSPPSRDDDERSSSSKPSRWIVCCDTSYSGDTMWIDDDENVDSDDNEGETRRANLGRGKHGSARGDVAFSELIVSQCVQTGSIKSATTHGVLSDGTPYESSDLTNDDRATLVGALADLDAPDFDSSSSSKDKKKEWWVKAELNDGKKYLLSHGEGFNVWNAVIGDTRAARGDEASER